MPGIDELLRSEGALWREEVDAHRPAEPPVRRRLPRAWGSTRARVTIVSVATVAAAAVVALSIGFGSNSASSTKAEDRVASEPSGYSAAVRSGPKLTAGMSVNGLAVAQGRLSPRSSSTAPVGSTALILSGTISLTERDNASVDSAAVRATGIADGAGGRVDADTQSTTGSHSATLVLRVPNSTLTGVTTQLARLGTVTAQQRQARDVTTQVADVTSRVTSARAAIAGLTRLYAKAGTVNELITVESALAQRQSDLEALEAQQRTLSEQTSLATLTVSITVRSKATPAPRHVTHHNGFVGGLRNGWHAFTRTALAIGAGIGAAVPFLIALLVILGAAGVIFLRLRRRRAT